MTTVGALTTYKRLLGMFVYIDAVVVELRSWTQRSRQSLPICAT
jgi:hypothetical protein